MTAVAAAPPSATTPLDAFSYDDAGRPAGASQGALAYASGVAYAPHGAVFFVPP